MSRNTCADAGVSLTGMQWVSWGPAASGRGTEKINACTPHPCYPQTSTLSLWSGAI